MAKSVSSLTRNPDDNDDNLKLSLASRNKESTGASFGLSEELVDHLNDQICVRFFSEYFAKIKPYSTGS